MKDFLNNILNNISNNISRIIKCIGIITFICGLFVSLRFTWEAIDYSDFDAFLAAIGIIIGSFISAIMFIGFSVIIEKIQEIINNQNEIIKLYKDKNNE